MKTTPDQTWRASRTAHLAGGCRAFNGFDPVVELYPAATSGKTVTLTAMEYGSLYSDLAKIGLYAIGYDFVSNDLETRRLVPANWRTFHLWPGKIWPCNEEMDRWAQIAYTASKITNLKLWDLARRISHQLRVCAWRLREVSEAYREQLRAAVDGGQFKPCVRYSDGFTWLGYLAVQSFMYFARLPRRILRVLCMSEVRCRHEDACYEYGWPKASRP